MGFHGDALFPTDVSWGTRGGPGFNTAMTEQEGGAIEAVSRWPEPRHTYDVSYGIKSYSQLASVRKHFWGRLGGANSFPFKDWADFSTGIDDREAPSSQDVTIATGDGTTKSFQLIKKYASGGITRTRTIRLPLAGALVALDTTLQTSGYTIDASTGVLTFTTAPTLGQLVKWGGYYYVKARYGPDVEKALNVAVESFGHGSIPSIELIEDVDSTASPEELWPGGSTIWGTITADQAITLAAGYAQSFAPSVAGLALILPDALGMPGGGRYFLIINQGSQAIDLKTTAGATVISIPASSGVDVVLLEDQTTHAKSWWAK